MKSVGGEHDAATWIDSSHNFTNANISYERTSIGSAGDAFMEEFAEEWYEGFMLEWERQMNHYLKTGRKI